MNTTVTAMIAAVVVSIDTAFVMTTIIIACTPTNISDSITVQNHTVIATTIIIIITITNIIYTVMRSVIYFTVISIINNVSCIRFFTR